MASSQLHPTFARNTPPLGDLGDGEGWVLDARHLDVSLHSGGRSAKLVDDVSLRIAPGEIFGLVGESGSGKSMTAMALLRLLPQGIEASGEVLLGGKNLLTLREAEMRRVRGGQSGMCQRVMIAMALAGGAKFIIADEPTTALDVTIQDQIVQLLERLVAEMGIAVLFISHDLGLVARLCGRIAVAYAGQIVETGDTRSLLTQPRHPYTRMLVDCVPNIDPNTYKVAFDQSAGSYPLTPQIDLAGVVGNFDFEEKTEGKRPTVDPKVLFTNEYLTTAPN